VTAQIPAGVIDALNFHHVSVQNGIDHAIRRDNYFPESTLGKFRYGSAKSWEVAELFNGSNEILRKSRGALGRCTGNEIVN
jgi:hypothetical protein